MYVDVGPPSRRLPHHLCQHGTHGNRLTLLRPALHQSFAVYTGEDRQRGIIGGADSGQQISVGIRQQILRNGSDDDRRHALFHFNVHFV